MTSPIPDSLYEFRRYWIEATEELTNWEDQYRYQPPVRIKPNRVDMEREWPHRPLYRGEALGVAPSMLPTMVTSRPHMSDAWEWGEDAMRWSPAYDCDEWCDR